jgi:hypothetical protein
MMLLVGHRRVRAGGDEPLHHARKIVVPDVGHMVNMEAPAVFQKGVLDFLAVRTPPVEPHFEQTQLASPLWVESGVRTTEDRRPKTED